MKLNCFLLSLFLISDLAFATALGSKRSLDITALPPDQQSELTSRFPQIKTGMLSLEVIDNIIRYLQLKPEYDLIQVIDMGSEQFRLHTERSTRISAVKIEGLHAISESDAKILFAININDVLNQDSLISGGEKLRQQYNQIGYRNASIDLEIPPDKNGNVQIQVKVKEGVQTLIGQIQFSSPNTELNRSLNSRFSRQKGNALTDLELAELIKKIRDYLSNRGYIRTEINGPEITFNADESKSQLTFKLDKVDTYSIDYMGNRDVASPTLSNILNLENYHSSSPNIGSELAAKVKNFYLSRGFARIEVQSEESEGRKPFSRKIMLNIEEGPKVKITKFEFSGNISRDSAYYTRLLKNGGSDLIKNNYYNKDDLDQSFRNMVVDLQNEGRLLAKINSTRTQYNKEKNQVTVYVNLDEGPLTQIKIITFTGNNSISSEELLSVLELNSNTPLKLDDLEKAIQNLRVFYQEKGYIEMAILNEKDDLVLYSENNTSAALNFKIYEGPRVSIANIVLDGNSFTKDRVLLNVIDLQPGDIVTPSKIEEAKSKLQRTGYFNTVEVLTLEEKTSTANRTLIIRVTERDPGLFTLGIGATNEQKLTLRGYAGLAYNNIFGTGRGISSRIDTNYNVAAEYKYAQYKVALGYLEPYLFETKFRGRVNLSWSSLITDFGVSKVSDVRQTSYSIERDFTSHVTGIWNAFSIATVKDKGINPNIPIPEITQDIGTIGPTLELDYRDNPFVPTRGNFTSISTEYSSPELGSYLTEEDAQKKGIRFVRSSASFTQYLQVPYIKNNTMVWANSIRGGYIRNLSNEIGVPYDKKGFYLGGGSTVRGFDGTSEYFPTREQLGIGEAGTYYLNTAATMYLFKSELRFPLFGSIGGGVFYDGGAVHIDGLNIGDEYRDSFGVGIHYNTPVGPLNVEFAWKLDPKPRENPFQLHLSIGSF